MSMRYYGKWKSKLYTIPKGTRGIGIRPLEVKILSCHLVSCCFCNCSNRVEFSSAKLWSWHHHTHPHGTVCSMWLDVIKFIGYFAVVRVAISEYSIISTIFWWWVLIVTVHVYRKPGAYHCLASNHRHVVWHKGFTTLCIKVYHIVYKGFTTLCIKVYHIVYKRLPHCV